MGENTLLIACIIGTVSLTGYFLTRVVIGDKEEDKLRDRLSSPAVDDIKSHSRTEALPLLQRVGQAAAQPFMPTDREKVSALRSDFARAGIYSANAIKVMTGGKVILLGLGVIVGYLVGSASGYGFMGLSVGGLLGYLAPKFWLKLAIASNQKQLGYGLADAMDLMVVCVEAGLTVDAAMQRVGQELAIAHPAISRELGIAHMETRVGLSRSEAMKNLGQRTGNEPLQALAAMLIQADRFGTSIAQALRIQAETLRLNRQHAAEEMAAKASVKMSFPLVLFIFPATFIVLAGPVVLDVLNSDIMK
jgi:tight adherence protein C